MSPKGDLAVAAIHRGSNMKKAFFYHKNGSLSVLKIDGKKVTRTQDVEVADCRRRSCSHRTECTF